MSLWLGKLTCEADSPARQPPKSQSSVRAGRSISPPPTGAAAPPPAPRYRPAPSDRRSASRQRPCTSPPQVNSPPRRPLDAPCSAGPAHQPGENSTSSDTCSRPMPSLPGSSMRFVAHLDARRQRLRLGGADQGQRQQQGGAHQRSFTKREFDLIVGPLDHAHFLRHRPGHRAPVQRHVGQILGHHAQHGGDHRAPARQIGLDAHRVDQRIELRVAVAAGVEGAEAALVVRAEQCVQRRPGIGVGCPSVLDEAAPCPGSAWGRTGSSGSSAAWCGCPPATAIAEAAWHTPSRQAMFTQSSVTEKPFG